MNKKLLLLCTIAVAGFVTLTAFGGKTLEQQKAEIAVMVQGKLDELRAAKEVECTDRVNLEAQRRFDEYLAAEAAAKPTTGKKTTSKGPSAKPVPTPTKPTSPKDDKMNQTQSGNTGTKDDKMQQTTTGDNKSAKDAKMKKTTGGN
ncbi:MAG: hypothetical protein IT270_07680 [Saprospiraceae bacterium]|nr:hypothetical protein [Saprospiraceae bacterium]